MPHDNLTAQAKSAKLVWPLLVLYVLILPLSHTAALRNILFISLVAITAWLAWQGRLRLAQPLAKPWLIYTMVALASLGYAVNASYSLGEIKTELGYGFLILLISATWINTPQHFSRLVWAIIVGNALLVASSFYYAYPLIGTISKWESGAFNIGVGKFSTYIVVTLPFLVAQWLLIPPRQRLARAGLALLIAANIPALYFTGNRAGFVALIVQVVALLVLLAKRGMLGKIQRHHLLLLGLTITLLGALEVQQFTNRDPISTSVSASVSSDTRWDLWRHAARNIAQHPFTGGGFGRDAFKLLNPDFTKTVNNPLLWHAHNTLLNIGIQMGIPGLLGFLFLMIKAWRQLYVPFANPDTSNMNAAYVAAGMLMFAGMIVKSQTDDFFNRDTALFFWLLIGGLAFAKRHPA